ncbi:hypothetical protein EZJ43_08905 [Pedobacter changchengzhani]|uniref:Uncharacterized protein n=1 Tax=Pedobacter changchengzhani TaxID=2529274 RepID=A0A4R5MLU8_9SPHI|nr:hypothetical protein [Pedobacter changchengzhani]TDG36618.1 hypothetical protein EZJ43_08905 [Pedobacter changchengzhani]
MKNIKLLLCVLVTFFTIAAHAQQNKLNALQDSLIKISNLTLNAIGKEKKLAENARFVKTLIEALKLNNAYNYPFDSLKTVSVINSGDQSFRILSWYLPLDDGTYRFYGTIQMNTNGGALKLYPLIDQTENIINANQITDNQKWFGARYYEIIPVTAPGKLPYYVLLGWKGNNASTTKKVIEILAFDKDKVVFGAPVFDGKLFKDTNRVIFEYNKQNAMMLKSDKKAGMIVYDHLVPFEESMVGKFEYYGSDLSFDGFKIIGGRLKHQENVDLKNEINGNDELYADPKKKLKPEKKF